MSILVALPDEQMADRIRSQVSAEVDLITWRPGDAPPDRLMDLLVLPYVVNYDLLAGLGGLVTHVQSQSLGFDGAQDHIPAGVTLSNAVGVHEGPTAEMAMTLILASQRGWPELAVHQAEEVWKRPIYPGLIGARVLLIGVGGIGTEFERRVENFGARLTKVARTARDGVHAINELPALLPNADIVVIAVPLSDDTRGMVNSAFLDQLPAGALVVNVARGPIVDTDALVEHVRSGAVRSALDVVDPEPLPPGHPLWSLPGSLISPHLGGNVASLTDRVDPLVVRQIERVASGQLPDHIVLP